MLRAKSPSLSVRVAVVLGATLVSVAHTAPAGAETIVIERRGEIVYRTLAEPVTMIADESPHSYVRSIVRGSIPNTDLLFTGKGGFSFAEIVGAIGRYGGTYHSTDGLVYGLSDDPNRIETAQVLYDSYQVGWRFEITNLGGIFHVRYSDIALDGDPRSIPQGPPMAGVPAAIDDIRLRKVLREDDIKVDGQSHQLADDVTVRITP